MKSVTRWGILGCGRIAQKFAADLVHVADAKLVAVASRDSQKSKAFAQQFSCPRYYGDYGSLAADREVDVIYVATPHGLHHEHVLLCLDYKKAVLCEKAFALNLTQVNSMIAKAMQEGVFLMEALWTKFSPHFAIVQQILAEGKLGNLRSMLVNFGFIPLEPIPERLYDPALGGGSLLDIGIYNVFITLAVLGPPDEIEASMTPAPSGVDEQCAILFKYHNGAFAQLFCSFSSNLATEADISGDRGRLRISHRYYEPGAGLYFYPGRLDSQQRIEVKREDGFGYQYEARHVGECLRLGLTESPVMTLADSVLLMETLDKIREVAGIRYAVD